MWLSPQLQVRRERGERGLGAGRRTGGAEEEEDADEDGLAADLDGSRGRRDNCQGSHAALELLLIFVQR